VSWAASQLIWAVTTNPGSNHQHFFLFFFD